MKAISLDNATFDTTLNQSEVPVLVDFWAEWCGPCKMLAPVLDDLAQEQGASAVIAKVNIDDAPQLAQRFNVTAVPTLVIFKDGKPVERIQGVQSKVALSSALTTAA